LTKRKITFGSYDTAANGWTLTGWKLGKAEQKTHYEEKQGGDGSWDLSTAMTDGIPRYKDRPLTVTLECSEGDRMSRKAEIDRMINLLDGMREDIKLPDDDTHYINGRLHVAEEYNDLAHAAVTVTAECKPWKFSSTEKKVTRTASATAQTVTLTNSGRRAVVPVLKVEGESASVLLSYGGASVSLTAGTHQWPDLLLTPGSHTLTYSGSGSLTITYREAVL
jgi:hypothetical protein